MPPFLKLYKIKNCCYVCASRGIYGDTNKNEASNPPKYVGLETLKKRLTFEGGDCGICRRFL